MYDQARSEALLAVEAYREWLDISDEFEPLSGRQLELDQLPQETLESLEKLGYL